MNEVKKTEHVLATGKATYVKPTMEVYEMETEGVIMDNTSGGDSMSGGGESGNISYLYDGMNDDKSIFTV